MEVYLDNSATTRCFDEVAQLMMRIMCEDYGNPSSMHHKGVEAEHYIRHARGETELGQTDSVQNVNVRLFGGTDMIKSVGPMR